MKAILFLMLLTTHATAQAFLQGQGDETDPVSQWMEHVTEIGDKVCLEIKNGFFSVQPPYLAVQSGETYVQLSPTFVDCKDGKVESIHSG